MFRLILFDIDGTLIRTGGAGEKAFARVFASEFQVPNGTEGISFSGRTDPSIVREFFLRHKIEPSPENFARFFDRYIFWLDQMLTQPPGRILPGTRDLLTRLRSLAEPPLLGLLTGNVRLGARIKLQHFGLWDYFETGGFGDDHEDRNQIAAVAKGRAEQLLHTSLSGNEILVIGDTPFDIACARAIKARVLAVATGTFTLEQLRPHQPDWAVASLENISLEALCAASIPT
jgi:phosphoglycolate phosphatase-like HAD superfamily hydrolase